MSRTKASFSTLQLLEFEGCVARKRRFHIFNSWNSKDASHESFVFNSSTLGIRRMPRTKALFSHLQLLEFQGCLARNLRFHLINAWNLKEASHESVAFMNQGCDLNVRICTKQLFFSGKRKFRCGEKVVRARDGLRRRRFGLDSFFLRAQWNGWFKVTFSLL